MTNETHLFIKICISLFSRGLMFLLYGRDEWRQGKTAIFTQLLLMSIACCVIFKNQLSTSSASWLGLLNLGSLALTLAACFRFFFWLFTQVHLCSVKGEYITQTQTKINCYNLVIIQSNKCVCSRNNELEVTS